MSKVSTFAEHFDQLLASVQLGYCDIDTAVYRLYEYYADTYPRQSIRMMFDQALSTPKQLELF